MADLVASGKNISPSSAMGSAAGSAAPSGAACLVEDLLASDRARANHFITHSFDHRVELISKIAANLIGGAGVPKGKQFRMLLTIISAHICGVAGSGVIKPAKDSAVVAGDAYLKLAAAVELIHSATLLHDDVVDQATVRRGRSTGNAIWSERSSVLVGDFLFARAFELMVDSDSLSALHCLSRASAAIVAGEIEQVSLLRNPAAELDLYLRVIDGKTAALYVAAMRAPSFLKRGIDSGLQDNLAAFGLAFGRLFQMVDDVLDYTQDEKGSGKLQAKDLQEGVATLPVILAYQQADKDERAFWREVFLADKPQTRSEEVFRLLRKPGGGIDLAYQMIGKEARRARSACDGLRQTEMAAAMTDKLLSVLNLYLDRIKLSDKVASI